MTRRERMERRLERRREWAESRAVDASRRFSAAHAAVANIPPGQPILVGHHSERRHRAALDRCDSNTRAGIESQNMAARHASVAGSLELGLDRSVFSDDADAIERLEERIREREAQAERIKHLNRLIRAEHRKGLAPGWLDRIGATEAERREIARTVAVGWRDDPCFPPFVLANLRGNIQRDRERIKAIKAGREAQAEAEAAPAGVVIKRYPGSAYCTVRFAEKPDRAILDALRAAGYYWHGGAWGGPLDKLPASVAALDTGGAELAAS